MTLYLSLLSFFVFNDADIWIFLNIVVKNVQSYKEKNLFYRTTIKKALIANLVVQKREFNTFCIS
ncbi:MAG: hypothetical protein RLZZ628_4010 [Bacteroidota bacterium]|jgi:hypothetical protein